MENKMKVIGKSLLIIMGTILGSSLGSKLGGAVVRCIIDWCEEVNPGNIILKYKADK